MSDLLAGKTICPFMSTVLYLGPKPKQGALLAMDPNAPIEVEPMTTPAFVPCVQASCAVWDGQGCGLAQQAPLPKNCTRGLRVGDQITPCRHPAGHAGLHSWEQGGSA